MTVKHIENMDDYKSLLELSKTKLVVIDFSAEWCVCLRLCYYQLRFFCASLLILLSYINVF